MGDEEHAAWRTALDNDPECRELTAALDALEVEEERLLALLGAAVHRVAREVQAA